MLQDLTDLLARAGESALRPAEPHLAGAACLVVATMLMDAETGEYVLTGTHPGGGVTVPGPVAVRFAAQVSRVHRQNGGTTRPPSRWWTGHAGIPPWAAAHQLSLTAGRTAIPARYLWYPVWRRPARALDRLALSLHRDRPALLYVGRRWRPRHVLLVVQADAESLWCYDPVAGDVRGIQRSGGAWRRSNASDVDSPVALVLATGRRVSD